MEITDKELESHLDGTLTGFAHICEIKFDCVKDGMLHLYADMDEQFKNPLGIIHGGYLSMLMDQATGMQTFYSSGGRRFVTRGASLHFLVAVTGGRLTARAKCIHLGRHTALTRAELFNEDGKLVATGDYDMMSVD